MPPSTLASIGSHRHATIPAHNGPCNVVRYNTLGRYILTGGSDRQIHLYNATNASTAASPSIPIKSYGAHSHEILALSISSDNMQFASGGGDKSVYVWDVASGTILRRFNAHVGKVNVVEFCGVPSNASAGGDSLLSAAGFDGAVRFYDLRSQGSWKPILELKQSRDAILSLAATSSRIYTGSVDGHVRTYDLRSGQLSSDLVDVPISSIRPSRNETSLLVASLDSTVRLFDTETGECLQSFTGHKHGQYRCRAVLTTEEDAVVMGDEEGKLHVWDLVSRHRREVIPRDAGAAGKAHPKGILWTEINPLAENGNEVATAGADGTVKIWRSSSEPRG
ncbi:uncharacterized protein PFL1_01102 [Pseudozyma flocculosa PF-1]|nr:uncharacterized protein PFL1_01102 [Pseudozyma flocculosa PF-1]EPQ31770.1 hypothetical protein PFL1_01102 [Pseudozyma flocculosa PF-1]